MGDPRGDLGGVPERFGGTPGGVWGRAEGQDTPKSMGGGGAGLKHSKRGWGCVWGSLGRFGGALRGLGGPQGTWGGAGWFWGVPPQVISGALSAFLSSFIKRGPLQNSPEGAQMTLGALGSILGSPHSLGVPCTIFGVPMAIFGATFSIFACSIHVYQAGTPLKELLESRGQIGTFGPILGSPRSLLGSPSTFSGVPTAILGVPAYIFKALLALLSTPSIPTPVSILQKNLKTILGHWGQFWRSPTAFWGSPTPFWGSQG